MIRRMNVGIAQMSVSGGSFFLRVVRSVLLGNEPIQSFSMSN